MKLNIKKLDDNAIIPSYQTDCSAGADLYACIEKEIEIKPLEMVMIPTKIALEIPTGYVGLIYARSGLATKKGLAPSNKVGVIDSDYRGELMVSLFNQSSSVQVISPNERVAQIVITPYVKADFILSDELSNTERNIGGFGSTGQK